MIFFLLRAFECNRIDATLLDTGVFVKPSQGEAYLGFRGMEAMLSGAAVPLKIREKGARSFEIYSGSTRICHKKEKDMVGDCSMGKNASEVWNIKKKDDTGFYSIKSGKEGFFTQYCLTYKKTLNGPVVLKKCKDDREKQLFKIETSSAPRNLPKPPYPYKSDESSSSQEDVPEYKFQQSGCSSNSRNLCAIKDQIDRASSAQFHGCQQGMANQGGPPPWQPRNAMQPPMPVVSYPGVPFEDASKLADKKFYASPRNNNKVSLHMIQDKLSTLPTPEVLLLKKGTRTRQSNGLYRYRWLVFFNGMRICHKADNTAGSCDTEGNVNNVWDIAQIEDNIYAMESEGALVNYCVTYNQRNGTVNMSPCERFYEAQHFVLAEPEETKNGESLISNVESKLAKFKEGVESLAGLKSKISGVFSGLNSLF